MAVKAARINPLNERRDRFRQIVTPEGVPIPVELASVSERAGALILDVTFCLLTAFLIVMPIGYLANAGIGRAVAIVIISFATFLIRNVYFLYFELMWGATPGKRIMGLRVIDRQGGPLLPSAVIARNLTREFEIFMPVIVMLSLGGVAPGEVAQWLSTAWLIAIGAIPFLNRDRMRGGDLIAGTMVIMVPRRSLLADQAQDEFHYRFNERELSAYGAHELQVLEQVLRGSSGAAASKDVLRQIGTRIRNKIGRQGDVPLEMEERFLRDFYTAERAYLEREQLFGRTKADKYHENAPPS